MVDVPSTSGVSPCSASSRASETKRVVARLARRAAQQAQLVEPRALAHHDAEAAGRDLDVERTLVARRHVVERAGAVGDQAGEDVEPAGRALGVGDGRQRRPQLQALQQRHDVDAARLQHRALGQVDLVRTAARRACSPPFGPRRQEARPDAIGRRGRAAGRGWRAALGRRGPSACRGAADLLVRMSLRCLARQHPRTRRLRAARLHGLTEQVARSRQIRSSTISPWPATLPVPQLARQPPLWHA